MFTSALKTFALVYGILILGELIPFQGQPLSHHALHSLQWMIREVKTSSYFQAGAEKAAEVGKQVRILFVGASAVPPKPHVTDPGLGSTPPRAAMAQAPADAIGSHDRRQLRALLREQK